MTSRARLKLSKTRIQNRLINYYLYPLVDLKRDSNLPGKFYITFALIAWNCNGECYTHRCPRSRKIRYCHDWLLEFFGASDSAWVPERYGQLPCVKYHNWSADGCEVILTILRNCLVMYIQESSLLIEVNTCAHYNLTENLKRGWALLLSSSRLWANNDVRLASRFEREFDWQGT